MAAENSLETLTIDIRVFEPGELAAAAADLVASHIAEVVAEHGACRLALAGGGTPRPVYQELATAALAKRVPWNELHVFWGDERCVPPDDESSNYRMAVAALLDHVPVPRQNVHRIEGERPPREAAQAYVATLGDKPIDILLLGMGGDGHTASLFPDTPKDLAATERVIASKAPVAPHDRVSLSLRAINEARAVYLLVAGAGKAERLAEVHAQVQSGAPVLPAAHLQPASGQLTWLVDREAAAALPR